MQKLRPINDQVVLKPLKEQSKIGNIIIPDTGNEKPIMAEVIAISEGIYNWYQNITVPHKVKVGDIVLIPKLGAQVVSLNNEELYVCQANQLLPIVEDEKS